MDHDEITRQTLEAFDDLLTDEERGEPGDPEEELKTVEEPDEDEQPVEEPPDYEPEEEPDEDEDEEAEEEDEDEPEEVVAEFSPDVQAFLAKYGGDVEAALKGAAELSHVLGRQGREKTQLQEQVDELQRQLARAQTFSSGAIPFNEEQREWIEEAAGSDNPAGFVQLAVDQGEFDLARAVCQEWAREDPFNAGRVGAQVDSIEQASRVVEQPAFDLGHMLEAARDHFPDMPAYWGQMSRLIYTLGDDHYLVVAARSQDVEEAARGIVGLYDMAKTTTVNVREAKETVRAKKRKAGDDVRREAQVTSAATSPAREQTPRQTQIMPGLTLEELEAEFARA